MDALQADPPLPAVRRAGQSMYSAALMLLAFLGVWLRTADLSRESLWFDEGMTWWLASLEPARMLHVIRHDVAAPLYFLLLHYWQQLFGDSAASMRAMSALASVLALWPFYLVLRRVIESPPVRLIACGLMAGSFMQIQYAQEARYYALLSLCGAVALSCVPTLAERRSWARLATFVFASAAGLYVHNMMEFVLVGLAAAWLIWPGPRPLRRRLVDGFMVGPAIALLHLPWVPTMIRQMQWMKGQFWAEKPGAFDLALATSAVSGVDVWAITPAAWRVLGVSLSPGLSAALGSGCLVIAILLSLFGASRASIRKAAALAAFAGLPVLLVFVYSLLRQPIFMERVLIASSLVTPILLALPLDRGRPMLVRLTGGLGVLLIAALALASLHRLLTQELKEDWRGAYRHVAALPPEESRVLLFLANEGALPFAYYEHHEGDRRIYHTGLPQGFFELDPPQTIRRVFSDADLHRLRDLMNNPDVREIVLVLSHDAFADPQGLAEGRLRGQWKLLGEQRLRLVRVLRFGRPD